MILVRWWHHLFNPHCPECKEEELDKKVCPKCEVLQHQLEVVNLEKQKLLDSILNKNESPALPEEPVNLKPRFTPWSVQRQQLEVAEQIRAAQIRKQKDQELVVQIEKEILEENNASGTI